MCCVSFSLTGMNVEVNSMKIRNSDAATAALTGDHPVYDQTYNGYGIGYCAYRPAMIGNQ